VRAPRDDLLDHEIWRVERAHQPTPQPTMADDRIEPTHYDAVVISSGLPEVLLARCACVWGDSTRCSAPAWHGVCHGPGAHVRASLKHTAAVARVATFSVLWQARARRCCCLTPMTRTGGLGRASAGATLCTACSTPACVQSSSTSRGRAMGPASGRRQQMSARHAQSCSRTRRWRAPSTLPPSSNPSCRRRCRTEA
jgi:hypothetical protein